jgi:uncharacterized protein (TIGR02246 family)
VNRTEDEWALYQLACKYARAVDSNDPDALDEVFTPDAVLEKGAAKWTGLDEIKKIPPGIPLRYLKTFHAVHNQTSRIDGDTAACETYSIAHNVMKKDGATVVHDMAIRYMDRCVRTVQGWRIRHRLLITDWTETRPATTG